MRREKFEPTSLVDRFGNERNMDGTPYIELYRRGEVEWTPPQESIHLDTGYWVYTGRQDGIPDDGGQNDRLCPTSGTGAAASPAERFRPNGSKTRFTTSRSVNSAEIPRTFPIVRPTRWTRMNGATEIFDLLDSGVETLVLSSPMVVYSGYEDFDNGFLHSIEYVHEWEAQNGRKINVVIAPSMGEFKPMRDGYLLMMKDKLDTLPAGASVKMVWSVHGMPWRAFPNEPWLDLAPAYRDVLVEESKGVTGDNMISAGPRSSSARIISPTITGIRRKNRSRRTGLIWKVSATGTITC